MHCDSLLLGLGFVLVQHGKVIEYASRQLKVLEKNYQTHDPELATIVLSLKIWRNSLHIVHEDVLIAHKSLQYMFVQRELSLRL